MDTSTILAALSLGEEKDWEFKAGQGWPAGERLGHLQCDGDTDGGVVVLRIAQKDGRFAVEGVPDALKMKQDFWNTVINRGKVGTNLLSNDEVTIVIPHSELVPPGHDGCCWCLALDQGRDIEPELEASYLVG